MSLFDDIRTGNAYRMLINGKWVEAEGKAVQNVYTPIDGSVIATVPRSSLKDAEAAVMAAYDSRGKIAKMAAVDRAKILNKIGDLMYANFNDLVDIIVVDAGKPKGVAKGEVEAAAERFKYAAEEAKEIRGESLLGDSVPWGKEKIGMVMRQPLGVVLAISPFNYPLFIAAAKIAPALAGGNSVVCKPASDDPLAVLYMGRLIQEAGMPEGVFNVITGSGGEIGDYLASHKRVNMISFTGSSSVGERIAKLAVFQKLHLELGGKSPALVLDDADLDVAAKQCISGAFKYSGQRCDAISRMLVDKKVADAFVSKIVEQAKTWKVGDPRKDDTTIGPLINQKALEKVAELVEDARKKGAKVLLGGKKLSGFYYEPTVLDGVTADMRIAWEETFGPVAAIMRVDNYEQAIALANQSEFGLDASVFTQDVDRAIDAGMRLEDGTVNINAAPAHGLGNFPFGGDKDSGMDREGIKFSVEEMMRVHTIIFNPKKK